MAISQAGSICLSRVSVTAAVVADLAVETGASREICPVDLTFPGQHVLATHDVSFLVFANLEVFDPLPRIWKLN
jgi:hypothetical protein